MQNDQTLPLAGGCGQVGSERPSTHARLERHAAVPGVTSYPAGVILRAGGSMVGNPTGKGGGIRGKVGGWTVASRRRLRMALLTLSEPEGWVVGGATYTIPGPVIPHVEARGLWAWYCLQIAHGACGMIWRVELQRRGMLHWHALIIGPDRRTAQEAAELWWSAIDRLGEFKPSLPYFGEGGEWQKGVVSTSSRMALPGAMAHAMQADFGRSAGNRGPWLRYLQDHASKVKQEQVPEAVGRHWGIVGRVRFRHLLPTKCDNLTPTQYAMVRRAYERLATPHRRAACAFGSALGYRVRRGRRGRAVCFVNPATVDRLVKWATSQNGGEHGDPVPSRVA